MNNSMYLRHDVIHKDGKKHTYWRLVRSVRIGNKIRQETVAQLGALTAAGRERARTLAQKLGGRDEDPGLFDPPIENEVAQIRLNGVKLERVRRFGNIWLGMKLWKMAGLEELFRTCLPKGKEDISWATLAEILVIARLCEPSSELHIAEDWLRKTALGDMLWFNDAQINDDRLYRGLDHILPLKESIEAHLKKQWETIFGIRYDLLLYDITSTYFEGRMEGNPLAQRGHSRDHRSDCKQVCIGLVVTREGYPLGYEIFPGNLHDSRTVHTIVGAMETRYGKADRIWVWDRGMQSAGLAGWMRNGGRRYVMALPKSELAGHLEALTETAGWKTVKNRGVEVKYTTVNEAGSEDVLLLCRSEERRQKEVAMHELFAGRIEKSLQSLARRLSRCRKPAKPAQAQRQIGRILERNQRSAGFFEIRCEAAPENPSGLSLSWSRVAEKEKQADLSDGCYVLRTNIREWKEEDIWSLYIQLTHVEAAFRIQKSELEIRPVWHQTEKRMRAHILVCFLAYVLWKIMEQWQSRAGLGNSPRTILEELGQIHSGDVVLPTVSGEQIRLRCIVRPEKAQAIILQRLGLDIPRRMRIPAGISEM